MITLLIDKLSAFYLKVDEIDFIFALYKMFGFHPIMHGLDKDCFEFVYCVIKPKHVSKIVLINASKVNLVVEVVRLLNEV
jgi:hypothetical protein